MPQHTCRICSMDIDTVLGTIVITAALIVLTGLVLWSRRTIEKISRRGPTSARQIMKDLDDAR
ncbi:MAG: hypothetical protein KAX78_05615 [Phycisphaerae bacterium]|nr:hypothetical protein [Phycisphaerae bacterium]